MSYLRLLSERVGGSNAPQDHLLKNLVERNKTYGDTAGWVQPATSAGLLASFESMDQEVALTMNTDATTLREEYRTMLLESGYAVEDITDTRLDAGVMIMMASGNIPGYLSAQFNTQVRNRPMGSNLITLATSSAFDYREEAIDMQAFDERAIRESLPFSIVWNTEAAVQNPSAELLYPTTVVGPDQGGITIKLTRPLVQNQAYHSLSGVPYNPNPQSLINAEIDHSILANVATTATPYYVPGTNDQNFVDPAVLAPWDVTQNGATFKTSAYKPGEKFSIVGLCMNPGTTNDGTPAYSDSLDQQVSLDTLYVRVKGTSATNPSLIAIQLDQYTTSQFQPAAEDLSRDMVLNFITQSPKLMKTTKDVTAATASTAGGLVYLATSGPSGQGLMIALDISASGRLNLELGNIRSPVTATITFASAWTTDPVSEQITQITDPAALAPIKAEYPDSAFTFIGYTIKAYRSNINRRTEGLITTNRIYTEVYAIPLGAPITAQTPVTDTRTTIDVASPIQAVRTRNSNNAITKLLDYAALLRGLPLQAAWGPEGPSIEGIGRHVIKPYFMEDTLDLQQVTASLTSVDRLAAVKSALVNKLRAMMSAAYRDSGYQVALGQLYPNEKPRIVIVTDAKTASYLIVDGDTRTMGGGFEFEIQACPDMRVFGEIYATLSRRPTAGPNALTFGTMAFMPELTTSLQMNRGGAIIKELMVQPRTRHINTCPLLVHITVENMEQTVGGQVPIHFNSV